MIINTDKIQDAVFKGTVEETANKYGLNTRTVGAYRRGERNIMSMKLETAMQITEKLFEEQLSNNKQALQLIKDAKFIFEVDTWNLYQKEADENSFVKVAKDDSFPPKEYSLSHAKAEAVLIMFEGLRDLQLQGQDLSDSYAFLSTDYFN